MTATSAAIGHVKPTYYPCAHKKYLLTCEQFDQMLMVHQGHCPLCGQHQSCTSRGLLVVDHDHRYGMWAVRGVICQPCNTRIEWGAYSRMPRVEAYLANPWYATMLASRGLTPDGWAEPDVGEMVSVDSWENTAVLIRGRAGWIFDHGSSLMFPVRMHLTWAKLNRRWGPHNIHPAEKLDHPGLAPRARLRTARVSHLKRPDASMAECGTVGSSWGEAPDTIPLCHRCSSIFATVGQAWTKFRMT